MPDFDEIFSTTKERPVRYKDKSLVRSDHFPFANGDRFLVTFEKTNSEWVQGVGLYVFGIFEIDGKKYQDRIVLWKNTSPKEMRFTLWEDKSRKSPSKSLPKQGLLGIKNIWDTGSGTIESWYWGAAMIVEEIENGRRYRCNDGHPDENFDDIVFTVQKLSETQ